MGLRIRISKQHTRAWPGGCKPYILKAPDRAARGLRGTSTALGLAAFFAKLML
jgi:hypothetical protein